MPPRNLAERFDSKVDRAGDCWIWIGGVTKAGYGSIWHEGQNRYAHRIAFRLRHGRDVEGVTRHICDNRRCVNPDHLLEGTQADNVADRDARGRTARGEQQGASVLISADVARIRILVGLKTISEISRRFGVSRSTITAIRDGKAWVI